MIIYNMDAYLVSNFIKKSLQKNKKIEHADFLTPGFFSPSIVEPDTPEKNDQYVE